MGRYKPKLECNQDDLFRLLRELKRKVNLTRISRLHASKRLRGNQSFYQKIVVYYSILIASLSIWFIRFGVNNEPELGSLLSNMLLVASISLTFFSMFISIKNYQERAFRMESSQLELGKLLNDIERAYVLKEQTLEEVKKLQRKYENILIRVENHEDIDYWLTKTELFERNSLQETESADDKEKRLIDKYKVKIESYNKKRGRFKIIGIWLPIIFPFSLWLMELLYKGSVILIELDTYNFMINIIKKLF